MLTPDFLRKPGAAEMVVAARPDVFNHNLETVPRLYPTIRPGARYFQSLRLLDHVKTLDPTIFTKSGLMVGLGEAKGEILQVMDDMRMADIDFLTLGQYLQPTPKHAAVDRFVTPDEFADYASMARAKGFLMVSATPLTRSSYHADSDFAALRAARPERPLGADPRRAQAGSLHRRADVRPRRRRRPLSRASCPGAPPPACAPAPRPSWWPT